MSRPRPTLTLAELDAKVQRALELCPPAYRDATYTVGNVANPGTETREERLRRLISIGALDPDCAACVRYGYLAAQDPVEVFAPRHTASPRCRSGGRPHCSCDTCF